uniref:Uncharacterized protein n=1 Tax=Avena sativa TaxID=4498 RepID=A0ACD5YYW0_AVESA
MELIKLFRGLYGNDNPENVVEAAGYLREAMLEVGKQEVKVIGSWLLDKLLGKADMEEPQDSSEAAAAAGEPRKDDAVHQLLMDMSLAVQDPMAKLLNHADSVWKWNLVMEDILALFKALKDPIDKFISHGAHQQKPQTKHARRAAAANEDLMEMIKVAKEPMEVARAEGRYLAERLRWLLHILKDDFMEEKVYHTGHRPRVVAIVTPPVDNIGNDDDDVEDPEELAEEVHATELARKVYDHPSTSSHFDTKVWVNAKHNSLLEERLKSILHQVLPGDTSTSVDNNQDPTEAEKMEWDGWSVEKLKSKIAECLNGKRFLIVLADPEDDSSWREITSALPDHGDSSVIVTPNIEHMAQFDGWYTASWFFLLMGASSRYHVHFCSNLVGLRKVAAQLVGDDQPQGGISAILKKCLWDSYATKMFLQALYANPHRSDAELGRLSHGLRYANSVGNARRMVRFCFDDLPRQYQSCLVCLSVFPPGKFKRASLVRRWAAENFVSARDGMTAVDEAGRCFDALVARGLLEPVDIGAAGKVKSCMIHPHVLLFITKIAKKDAIIDNTNIPPDFAHRLSTRGGILHLLLENQAAANSNNFCCWGVIRGRRHTPQTSKDLCHQVVTLLNSFPSSSDQLGLVKLLDLEGCKGLKKRTLKKICDKIFQLKYLSLRNSDATELPKEINKLRYLETLDIRQTKVQSFPANTVALPKLMHLLAGCPDNESSKATGSDKPFSTVRLPTKISSMTNMQVLSHVEVSESDMDELEDVGRKLHLRKLGVVIRGEHPPRVLRRVVGMLHESLCSLSVHIEQGRNEGEVGSKEDGANGSNDFVLDENDIPKSLESLNIKGKINEVPTWIKLLHRLSKITLCHTKLRDEDIQRLGGIANLRCIRLWHMSYTEKKITFSKSGFRKLEFLVIEDSCICNIEFDEDAAPRLKKIVWSFTTAEVTLSGIKKLQSLKEILIGGSCDMTHLSEIRKEASKNPNLPKVTATNETGVGASTNASSSASNVATGDLPRIDVATTTHVSTGTTTAASTKVSSAK